MDTNSLTQSKKAKALLIALINLNAIFLIAVLIPTVPVIIVTQMITSVLFLAGLYVGVQGGIDIVQAFKKPDKVEP